MPSPLLLALALALALAAPAAGCDEGSPATGGDGGLACAPLTDVTALIGGTELFYGYPLLGADVSAPGCGELADAREIYLSLTPDFGGELVLSTVHPSTTADTVLEVREGACDGSALGCNDRASADAVGSRVTIPVTAGSAYVALVETADDEGVFALGLHRAGVCEGLGSVADITADLLTGQRFLADTAASTASLQGSCAAGDHPEARLAFTAPRSGVMAATTIHPDTGFDTVLFAREGALDGASLCDSPEAEIACENDTASFGTSTIVRFDVLEGRAYDLFVDGAGGGSAGQGQATLTLGYAATSPVPASLQGCDHAAILDEHAFLVQGGQAVVVKVDTVDAATAADTRLRVRLPDGTELHEADDEVDCTYPPPSYRCPQYSFTAGAAGLYSVEVYVGSSESCHDRSLVNYQLTATLDGEPADTILVTDE